MTQTFTGGCQCGAVRFRTTELADNAHLCHCRMCQKAMGNFFAPLVAAPRTALTWVRGTPARFRSSEHVDRGFCSACGTPLFYEDLTGTHLNLTIGSMDHPELIQPKDQCGMEARMPYFAALATLPDHGETGSGGGDVGSDDLAWAAAIKATNRQHPDHDTDAWPVEEQQP